jgi:hypothetical protein
MKYNKTVIARNEAISATDSQEDKIITMRTDEDQALRTLICICRDCFVPRNDVWV